MIVPLRSLLFYENNANRHLPNNRGVFKWNLSLHEVLPKNFWLLNNLTTKTTFPSLRISPMIWFRNICSWSTKHFLTCAHSSYLFLVIFDLRSDSTKHSVSWKLRCPHYSLVSNCYVIRNKIYKPKTYEAESGILEMVNWCFIQH